MCQHLATEAQLVTFLKFRVILDTVFQTLYPNTREKSHMKFVTQNAYRTPAPE